MDREETFLGGRINTPTGEGDYFCLKMPHDWGRQVEWQEILREGQAH